jgi:hypothetical protein
MVAEAKLMVTTNGHESTRIFSKSIGVNWWLGLAPAVATRAKVPLESISIL